MMQKGIVLVLLSLGLFAIAGKPPVYQKKGVAIKGFDTVAYHTEGKAVKGSDQHTHSYMGAVWHFASAANKDLFKANPEKYAPKYGGYCAYAAAKNSKAKIEGDAWKIVDGKLYLNYDKGIQRKWEKKMTEYIGKADENWPTLKDK